jgi:hypothetical protein
MKLFILKIYFYDCSSYDLENVDVKVCSSLELCELEYKKFIYKIYLENEEFIEFEKFNVEEIFYENYNYEIIESELIN